MKLRAYLLLLLIPIISGSFSIQSSDEETHNITVEITNIRNSNGRIQVQVFRTSESFADENPYKILYVSKKSLSDKKLSYTIYGLKTGTYGLALLDDENANKEMDYSWMVPDEGFGFSDYYHTAWSKPKFNSFKFTLNSDKKVTMKVRYM